MKLRNLSEVLYFDRMQSLESNFHMIDLQMNLWFSLLWKFIYFIIEYENLENYFKGFFF